jgi:hypothetical protein
LVRSDQDHVEGEAPVPGVPAMSAEVIDCPDCRGVGVRVEECVCRALGGRFDGAIGVGEVTDPLAGAWEGCQRCGGEGSLSRRCPACRGTGRVRAQVVLSVVNTDTAQVASTALVAGVLPAPVWRPGGRWIVDLAPQVAELARRVDAAVVLDDIGADALHITGDSGSDSDGFGGGGFALVTDEPMFSARWHITLPEPYFPDLPPAELAELTAQAIVGYAAGRQRWRVWRATSRPTPPPPDPDHVLRRLCRLATDLLVDLTVEVRATDLAATDLEAAPAEAVRWRWNVRFDLPDVPVGDLLPYPTHRHLTTALAAADVHHMLTELSDRHLDAPAHRPDPYHTARGPAADPVVDPGLRADPAADPGLAADLEARLVGLAASSGAAIASWRNHAWHPTALKPAGQRDRLWLASTGQVVTDTHTVLRRVNQPPRPGWAAGLIPETRCPTCRTGTPWRRCGCRALTGVPDPDCPACSGAGVYAVPGRCPGCGGVGALRHETLVTLTDGTRVHHTLWTPTLWTPTLHPGEQPSEQPSEQPVVEGVDGGGTPIVRLPDRYDISYLAQRAGLDPDRLTDDGFTAACYGWTHSGIGASQLDGRIHADRPDHAAAGYVTTAAIGRAAARILLHTTPPPAHTLDRLVAVVLALGLHLDLSTHIWRPPGAAFTDRIPQWAITLLPPDTPTSQRAGESAGESAATSGRARTFWYRTLTQATAEANQRLISLLQDTTPTDPTAVLAVPQQATPLHVDLRHPEPLLRRVVDHYTGWRGETLTARFTPNRCQLLLEASTSNTSDTDLLTPDRDTVLGELAAGPTFADAVAHLPLDGPSAAP